MIENKEFTLEVKELDGEFVTVFIDALDWEFKMPVDFFPDVLHLNEGHCFKLELERTSSNIHDGDFGGYVKQQRSTRFIA